MRLGVVYGNGCTCNKCHKVMLPREAIKLKVTKLSDIPEKASTGHYKTLGHADLCEKCFKEILQDYLEEPRRVYKKEII